MLTHPHRTSARFLQGDRRAGAGIGILVLLITILLALLLYFGTFGGKSYMQNVAASKKTAAAVVQDINTQQLSILIAQYRQTNNKLPKTPEDLESGNAFMDPWGHEMTFTFETVGEATRVKYHSNGPDGQPGTEDDITKVDTLPF